MLFFVPERSQALLSGGLASPFFWEFSGFLLAFCVFYARLSRLGFVSLLSQSFQLWSRVYVVLSCSIRFDYVPGDASVIRRMVGACSGIGSDGRIGRD